MEERTKGDLGSMEGRFFLNPISWATRETAASQRQTEKERYVNYRSTSLPLSFFSRRQPMWERRGTSLLALYPVDEEESSPLSGARWAPRAGKHSNAGRAASGRGPVLHNQTKPLLQRIWEAKATHRSRPRRRRRCSKLRKRTFNASLCFFFFFSFVLSRARAPSVVLLAHVRRRPPLVHHSRLDVATRIISHMRFGLTVPFSSTHLQNVYRRGRATLTYPTHAQLRLIRTLWLAPTLLGRDHFRRSPRFAAVRPAIGSSIRRMKGGELGRRRPRRDI